MYYGHSLDKALLEQARAVAYAEGHAAGSLAAQDVEAAEACQLGSYEVRHFAVGDYTDEPEIAVWRLVEDDEREGDDWEARAPAYWEAVAEDAWLAYVDGYNETIVRRFPGARVCGED